VFDAAIDHKRQVLGMPRDHVAEVFLFWIAAGLGTAAAGAVFGLIAGGILPRV